jgi:hypothetical protein
MVDDASATTVVVGWGWGWGAVGWQLAAGQLALYNEAAVDLHRWYVPMSWQRCAGMCWMGAEKQALVQQAMHLRHDCIL